MNQNGIQALKNVTLTLPNGISGLRLYPKLSCNTLVHVYSHANAKIGFEAVNTDPEEVSFFTPTSGKIGTRKTPTSL